MSFGFSQSADLRMDCPMDGDPLFLLIIPGMALYGYGLCKLGTWIAFQEVLKAIRKAFPICD